MHGLHFLRIEQLLGWSLQVSAFVIFAYDKASAIASGSRIPNMWLRWIALLAGPGAISAMLLFRHKIRYPSLVGLAICSTAAWAAVYLR